MGKGTVELGSEEEKKQAEEELKEKKETYKDLLEYLQKALDEQVKEVRLSSRLRTSPVLRSRRAAAAPRAIASSAVRSWLATPRTPSVPKSRAIVTTSHKY